MKVLANLHPRRKCYHSYGRVILLEELESRMLLSAIYVAEWSSNIANNNGTIDEANFDGTGLHAVVSGFGAPNAVALDLTGDKIYWDDIVTNKIQRSNLDGSDVEDLVTTNLTGPRGLALDLIDDKMYWADPGTDSGIHATIERSNLDGTDRETLITFPINSDGTEDRPDGLALDVADGKMYWTDLGLGTIYSANLNGSDIQTLVSGLNTPLAIALDVPDDKMYWTANNWGDPTGPRLVQGANLNGSQVTNLITSGIQGPAGIALDLVAKQMYVVDGSGQAVVRAGLNGANFQTVISSGLLYTGSIALDTTPSVSTSTGPPELTAGSDTGQSNSDDLTKLNNSSSLKTLTFLVPNTIVGAMVNLYADGSLIGSAEAIDSSTSVVTDGTSVLSDGVHAITAMQTEIGDTESIASSPLNITVDTVSPSVTINQAAGQVDPTATSPVNFSVVFNDPVVDFGPGDVTLSGTAGATTATVTGSGTTYNVAVSGMTQTGTVSATIPADVTSDAAGNPNDPSTSSDNLVTFLPVNHLLFSTPPTNAIAGSKLNPAVVVSILNANGQVITADNGAVKISLLTSTDVLKKTFVVTAKHGLATFSNLMVTAAGTYFLRATHGSFATIDSTTFTVAPAAQATQAFTTVPGTATAGTDFVVQVTLKDKYGNVATNDSSSVTLSLAAPAAGAPLGGVLTVQSQNGVASFSGLSITKAGKFKLTASDGAIPHVTSNTIVVTPDSASSQLVLLQQPAATKAGKPLTPSLKIGVEDHWGNLILTNHSQVVVSILNNGPGGTLSGILSKTFANGLAVFNNLSLSQLGNYTLQATDSGLALLTPITFIQAVL